MLAATYISVEHLVYFPIYDTVYNHVLWIQDTNSKLLGLYLTTNFYLGMHINHPKEAAKLVHL